MARFDLSPQVLSLLADEDTLQLLPPEILLVIRNHRSQEILDAVSKAASLPQLTGRVFAHFETLIAEICARWLTMSNEIRLVEIIAAFGRIMPFAPYLAVFLDKYLRDMVFKAPQAARGAFSDTIDLALFEQSPDDLVIILLAIWRLNSFDRRRYLRLSQPSQIQSLFCHQSAPVRYLAIRIFCQIHQAADSRLEALIKEFVQQGEAVMADFDGKTADYTFLSLYEHSRGKEMERLRQKVQTQLIGRSQHPVTLQSLSQSVAVYGQAVIPRPQGQAYSPSILHPTPVTTENLERLAELLKSERPILLHGLSGSGKTSLVREMARELAKDDTLVTLHLNEQTDAKVLIGLYATNSKPGSFQWRPGVLTTAVREGRWVLIEDLDRAPNEVMSTLLPLIERGELLVPNRGERIQACDGFRIFATVRTSLGSDNQENLPNLLGMRLWQLCKVNSLPRDDLAQVMAGTYPRMQMYTGDVLAVFEQLQFTTRGSGRLAFGRGLLERPISARDLLKWCRRLDLTLQVAGHQSGREPVTETTRDRMFMEAVECFVGSVKEESARLVLISSIAKQMRIAPERVRHYLDSYTPDLQDLDSRLIAGRISFTKRKRPSRMTKTKRPFASTMHARRLLEQIAAAVSLKEPVLLVGETGVGKTTVVQQLAESLGHKLVAINLSQQSEAGDLLGGFKPVSSRTLAMPLKEELEDLLERTGVSAEKNMDYFDKINKNFSRAKWREVAKDWRKAPEMFESILSELQKKQSRVGDTQDADQPAKRRKTNRIERLLKLKPRWEAFSYSIELFERQIAGSGNFAFAFSEGNIVKAARNGDWVLLDEINLASSDTLECIADLFQSGPDGSPSVLLSETGEIERIVAHADFRVFGAMNPATDVGKRDLPPGLRSRFTEIYVGSPDKDKKDLLTIIKTYLAGNNSNVDKLADQVAELYLKIKQLAETKAIVDGANEVPHFSLRTLTRVLTYANDVCPVYGLLRALYEGFCMGFLTLLSRESEQTVMPLIQEHILQQRTDVFSVPPKAPADAREYIAFTSDVTVSSGKKRKDGQYWLLQGTDRPVPRPDYIRTPYVQRNLLNLVRATSTRRYPILIQGPTSSGKTSMIEYLANASGNKFVRINNHEHTDLQEYLGTYVSGLDGRLKFQEGLLVQAMRQGSWIVLDELNLAPTDVLEALNRLLDDNRELLIPETQEVVRPHESFMLFATQNPPGVYGGRKVLSRAFRNRFLELHFDDIPEEELQTILEKRSRNTAPSDCRRIVDVYKTLARLRQEGRVFEQKNSFATLRDLFRWAMRGAETRQDIAENGFMLLAERVRRPEEREAVKDVIEKVFKVKIDPDQIYNSDALPEFRRSNSFGVIWTKAMRRLSVLVRRAIQNDEPVLLVGETGCGKTTICQLLAEADGTELHIVNAHQNTETGDLVGSQRPVRNRVAILTQLTVDLHEAARLVGSQELGCLDEVEELEFWYKTLTTDMLAKLPEPLRARIQANLSRSKALFEWCDGSLVHAMKTGHFFLLDEISLADDSVLERLNSVLESKRSLLLAEKVIDDNSYVEAMAGFQFFATMNPGGDFGKKELSPALRNRFTEIWVPPLSEAGDAKDIVQSKLNACFKNERFKIAGGTLKSVASVIVDFSAWFGKTFRPSSATAFSLRDILGWVDFMNKCEGQTTQFSLVQGAATIFIDTIGANPSALVAVDGTSLQAQRQLCLDQLSQFVGSDVGSIYYKHPEIKMEGGSLRFGDFGITSAEVSVNPNDDFRAPTTKLNAMRVARALQLNKPVLLEGNPGVGKTTLVTALARSCGIPLTRINLSDQTDLMDLFGTDVPVEGAEAGHFVWKDGPFLQAMQKGEWVLLDEMNLASQSVLEGLNACLDHRGEVHIAELDQVFKRHEDFKLFAAQNPHHQGGGRKGLPSSFVNRFVVVYADVFTNEDLALISSGPQFSSVDDGVRHQIIDFVSKLDDVVVNKRLFGAQGSPWEFNLRDTLRWMDLLASPDPLRATASPEDFLDMIIRHRFRTARDRDEVEALFSTCFHRPRMAHDLYHNTDRSLAQVGLGFLPRSSLSQETPFPCISPVSRLAETESIILAIGQNLPCILVGPSGSGKSVLLQHVAALAGKSLVVFSLNADVDTMDLIGGFEQADPLRELHACVGQLQKALQAHVLATLPKPASVAFLDLLAALRSLGRTSDYKGIIPWVQRVLEETGLPSTLREMLLMTSDYLGRPLALENPRFEWLDGVIVKAVENGEWLVLDNANLCNASVLDRLNSLLERPNGFLSINEHSGPGGEPRIIKPHTDFRIFLTVDPRYGELSRAMRNRSVEIYLDGEAPRTPEWWQMMTPVEASLQRFHTAEKIIAGQEGETEIPEVKQHVLDLLSLEDAGLLAKYSQAMNGTSGLSHLFRPSRSWVSPAGLYYVESETTEPLRKAMFELYEPAWNPLAMPLHPISNSPLVRILARDRPGSTFWLATCYEFFLKIHAAQGQLNMQLSAVNTTKPSKLSRLQRSYISNRLSGVAKDSTVQGAEFLVSMIGDLRDFVLGHVDAFQAWKAHRSVLRSLLVYWGRTNDLLSNMSFDEARFQAHLTQGFNLFGAFSVEPADDVSSVLVDSTLARLEKSFDVGFKLSTGRSMEVLWIALRPTPMQDMDTLEQVVELERLADRFDTLRWKVETSIPELASVVTSMAHVYSAVRANGGDAADLVRDLQKELSVLESMASEDTCASAPFFAHGFEALRQLDALDHASTQGSSRRSDGHVSVLSSLPTVSQLRMHSLGSTGFQLMDYILVQNSDIHPWTDTTTKSLLLGYAGMLSASLQELRSLERELPAMGRAFARATGPLTKDHLMDLNRLLLRMFLQVMASHDETLSGKMAAFYEQLLASNQWSYQLTANPDWQRQWDLELPPEWGLPAHLSRVFKDHFAKCLLGMAAVEKQMPARSAYAAIAWVQFALGCIKLYVPDKIFDPYLRAEVENDYHRELRDGLESEIEALARFDVRFTGQATSLRREILVDEVRQLGEHRVMKPVFRPSGDELTKLQADFNNVLNSTVNNDFSSTHLSFLTSDENHLEQMEKNMAWIVERFTGRYPAYQDLTVPLVNFLRCLQIGLSLSVKRPQVNRDHHHTSEALLAMTPFLDGTLYATKAGEHAVRSFEFLSLAHAAVSVEGLRNLPEDLHRAIFNAFASFHDEWSKKLEADRKQEETKQSLYRFKGGFEDEEEFDAEQFDRLFPDYASEDGQVKARPERHAARDLSVLLAEAHERIFLRPREPQATLQDVCMQMGRKAASEQESLMDEPRWDKRLVPAALLILDRGTKAFEPKASDITYNFYEDANAPEVRKLLALVKQTKSRFEQLRKVDEISHHQSLADVVASCDVVLNMALDEPLAKLMVGVERLHALVSEWQDGGWASREHKATAQFGQLRDMICDWRRLELSSWSRLFDMEERKCSDHARSWWFIAYGAVILEPWTRVQGGQEDLRAYASELLQTLELYFADTVVGQFVSQLHLLSQLKNHLDVLVPHGRALATVRDAVQNFVLYYGRYETKVAEAIRIGRAPLDRSMKDVLLMYKWNDKNIDALRESARKSHQKLFKLVRKFRDVLGQSIKPIIAQGTHEEMHVETTSLDSPLVVSVSMDWDAVLLSQQLVPEVKSHAQWDKVCNADIAKAIAKFGTPRNTTVRAAETLDSYVSDLVSSMSALRKETPADLTDENKEAVQHLKTRKTKLYVDTLKTLRQMGFSRSLGTTVLDVQKSTAVLLAGSGLLETDGTDHYYHKALELAPAFRQAATGHSEDLSREAVQRSVGYLEGILHVALRQRQWLSRTSEAMRCLQDNVTLFERLAVKDDHVSVPKRVTNCKQVLVWAVQVLKFGIHLVSVHGSMGGLDNGETRLRLETRLEALLALQKQQEGLAALPRGLSSSEHDQVEAAVEREMSTLRNDLDQCAAARPDLSFVTDQIRLWTEVHATNVVNDAPEELGMQRFATEIMNLFSKILVAMQKFQESAQSLPASVEDASWLVKYSDGLSRCIEALRMREMDVGVQGLFEAVKRLDLEEPMARKAATMLSRVFLPALQQYCRVCVQNLTRFAHVHRATCRLQHQLSKSFVQLASQGFCMPKEKSTETSGESGKLEGGTGLGDGDGAEDISKDVQPDEDLSELAQDSNNKANEGEMENQKDAVDMGEDELEGDLGSVDGGDDDEEDSQTGEEEEDANVDEEAGDVDDLDPTAVDEKMWDGADEHEADKDQQGDKAAGQKKEDEQVAADDERKDESGEKGDDDANMEDEAGQEEEEGLPQDEPNRQDQNMQESETLALPEDMDIDVGDEDDLDEEGEPEEDAVEQESDENEGRGDGQEDASEQGPDERDEEPKEADMAGAADEPDSVVDTDGEADEESLDSQEHDSEKKERRQDDNAAANQEDTAPSDVKTGGGSADEGMEGESQDDFPSAAQREEGAAGESTAPEQQVHGAKGAVSQTDHGQPQEAQERQGSEVESRPFKKLGDALERWYRNQKDIQDASQDAEQNPDGEQSNDMSRAEFQHLAYEDAPADTQALGTATDEEARPVDDAMAIDTETDETQNQVRPDVEDEDEGSALEIPDTQKSAAQEKEPAKAEDARTGASTHQGAYQVDKPMAGTQDSPMTEDDDDDDEDEDEELHKTSRQLSTTSLDEAPVRLLGDFSDAARMWNEFQVKTQTQAQSLTSQLRLILTPSQSTKLSGAFRTGKRLNIKKIIPYIASGYKRDKIWTRRAVPTKRAYQILICVDDSRSMGSHETTSSAGSGPLALESLVMVSRALALLEAGQVGVLGFGDDVFVAHDLASSSSSSPPFATSLDAGARVLQHFTFAQRRTDLVRLLDRVLDLFARARLQRFSAPGSEDLWQLALVLSDGLVQRSTHAHIRPLLRAALEQRVMVVFVVLDDSRRGESVLDLKEARFTPQGDVVIERYLDSFPFPYYLIVHDLDDLPTALAGLLRNWFAEVSV